jgi:hypothetical protein
MRKILGLLSCILFISSCDDGNMTTEGVNFDPAAPVKTCSANEGLYYKINGPEALILQTPPTSFANEVTPENQPRIVLIDNNSTKVLLRSFNVTVSDSYFCSVIPPSTPAVTEEWNALSGVAGQSGYIEITTTAITDQNTQTTTGYNHKILFKNITFANSKSSFVYDNYVYGNYVTAP